jgi:eukaryotic-like serine/threonine-protein kinase
MHTASHQLPDGTILGDMYRILHPLDVKDLWTVYRASPVDVVNPQTVALKVTSVGRLRSEALRLSGVSAGTPSPFPTFYRLFQDGSLSCMAIEYIPGISLYDVLFGSAHVEGVGRLTKDEVVAIGVQLAAAAMALHTRRSPLIFCGFRPANILQDERQSGRVCLPDLSVARPPTQVGGKPIPPLAIRGSEGYMPPEYDWAITPRTDIYGLGATLWVLLTGEESWRERGIFGNWSISPLVRLLRSMVNENPKHRPMTMAEVGERLLRLEKSSESKLLAPPLVVPKGNPIPQRASASGSKPASKPPLSRMHPVPRRSGMWK